MTGTADKPAEAPAQLAEATSLPPSPSRLFWPSPKTVRHVVIEVLIVTIGVLLALGIDQLRQHFTREAQAKETRQLLRAEVRGNLEIVEEAMRDMVRLYKRIDTQPEEAPTLSRLNGVGTPALYDTAYTVALQTGAFAYLRPEERNAIAAVYRSQENVDRVRDSYREAYWKMTSFPAGKLNDPGQDRDRLQQVMLVLNLARSVFVGSCRQMARTKIALGDWTSEVDPMTYCAFNLPSVDVEALIAGKHLPIPRPSLDLPEPPQSEAPN